MNKKGFIFSLDAFIAFTIALIAIYTLIFFSSIPYGHYTGLMQAHYLAKDSLTAISQSQINTDQDLSKLDYLVLNENYGATPTFLNPLIPEQFGYSLETYDKQAGKWLERYNTASDPNPNRNKVYRKLKTSSYLLVFNYKNPKDALKDSPNQFGYITCQGEATQCIPPLPTYDKDNANIVLVRLTVYI